MTDELKDEQAIWPLLLARVRALPEGDVLAFELEGCGVAIQKELERLRSELANALSIANSRTYCMDSPEVLKARVGELEKLAFPPTHHEQGQEDADEVCDACSHSAEHREHTYKDCLANHLAVSDNVTGMLQEENARLEKELAEARAIGEQSRITKVEAAMLTDAMRYPDNGALHCRWCSAGPREGHESRCWYAEQVRRVDAAKQLTDRLSARAATGEPKEAT